MICAAVGGVGVWMSQPSADTLAPRCSVLMACCVSRCWRRRPGRERADLLDHRVGQARALRAGRVAGRRRPDAGLGGPRRVLEVFAVNELHLGDARQSRPQPEDVGAGADLRAADAKGLKQLRGGDEELAAPAAPGRRVLQRGTRRLEFATSWEPSAAAIPCAAFAIDARRPGHRAAVGLARSRKGAVGRVGDELIGATLAA